MAYACPVCTEPQVDAEHLANHLAFTAIGGDTDHEAWLDTHAEGWGELGQAELAEIVVEHAEETEFPVDVEDASGGHGGHSHDHGARHGDPTQGGDVTMPPTDAADLDEDAQDVLAEARELTRQMREGEDGGDADAEDGADAEDDAGSERSDSETQ